VKKFTKHKQLEPLALKQELLVQTKQADKLTVEPTTIPLKMLSLKK
jgi:hypothetical protein